MKKILFLILLISLISFLPLRDSKADLVAKRMAAGLNTYLGGLILFDEPYLLLLERTVPGTQIKLTQPMTALLTDALAFSGLAFEGKLINQDHALFGTNWDNLMAFGKMGAQESELLDIYRMNDFNRELQLGIPTATLSSLGDGWGTKKLSSISYGMLSNIEKMVEIGSEVDGPIGAAYFFIRSLRILVGFTDWTVSKNAEKKLNYDDYEAIFMLLANLKKVFRTDRFAGGKIERASFWDDFVTQYEMNTVVEMVARIERGDIPFAEMFPDELKESVDKLGQNITRLVVTGLHALKAKGVKAKPYDFSIMTYSENACYILGALGFDDFKGISDEQAVKAVEKLYKELMKSRKKPDIPKIGNTTGDVSSHFQKIF